jgi:hypothetical protein
MARGISHYVRSFFLNWSNSDAPAPERAAVTAKNRYRALVHGGCCGHPGEPGC